MSNEIIEAEYKSITQELQVSTKDVTTLKDHMATIKSFVQSELKEGINNDFAVIPGTAKKALLKPGAEKLMKLFGLSSTVECIHKEIDILTGFAMFIYKAKVIHIRTGHLVAECEGVANSHERKYKKQNMNDILNTLMKMAQKRAVVGAVIQATAASDYFTQDPDEIQAQRERKTVDSSRFTQGNADNDLGSYEVRVGKYKGRKLGEIEAKELTGYCKYITENSESIDGVLKEFIDKAREYLRGIGAFTNS